MTAPPEHLIVDAGAEVVKAMRQSADEPAAPVPAAGRAWTDRVSAGLAATGLDPSSHPVCLTVPESWLAGTVEGTTELEAARYGCARELGLTGVSWVGQLSAAAGLVAQQRGPGRYLVCDIGATGVRLTAVDITAQVIRIAATYGAGDGGSRDFTNAVRALPGAAEWLPDDWYLTAAAGDRRARAVLSRAAASAAYRETPVYTFSTPDGDRDLQAGQLMACFTATEQRIRAGLTATAGKPVDTVVLTGGFGWFPLAAMTLEQATGVAPVVADATAGVRGAALLMRGTVALAPPAEPAAVELPMHQIRGGQLEETSLGLSWTEPFTATGDGPLVLSEQQLTVDVAGRRATVPLPAAARGPSQIGLRQGWSGASALVIYPAGEEASPVVVSLDAVMQADPD